MAFEFKNKTYVQNVTMCTGFPKLLTINLKTDQVLILHVLTKVAMGQKWHNINRDIIWSLTQD